MGGELLRIKIPVSFSSDGVFKRYRTTHKCDAVKTFIYKMSLRIVNIVYVENLVCSCYILLSGRLSVPNPLSKCVNFSNGRLK